MNHFKKAAGIAASLALLFAITPAAVAEDDNGYREHRRHQGGHQGQGHRGGDRGHHGTRHSGGGYGHGYGHRGYGYGQRGYGYGRGYRRGNRHRHAGSSNYCSINHSYSSGYGSYGYNNGYNSGYGNNGYRDRNSGYGRGYSSGSGYGYNNGRGHRQSRYQVGGRYGYGSHSVILGDYNAYGLYSPPHGYHWVRDRDRRDAILCSVATGAIIGLAVGVLNEY